MLLRKSNSKAEDQERAAAEARQDASRAAGLDRLKRFATKPAVTEPPVTPSASASPKTESGRRSPRKSSVIGGVITASSMVAARPCKVVDMSATGARIRLMPTSDQTRGLPAGVPEEFTLVLKVDRIEVDCVVAWRKERELGVKFRGVPRPMAKGR